VLAKAPGLVFGNGDPNSTSGFVVPGYYIFAARGLDPRRLFKRTTQANHEENFLAVAEGRADVATSNDSDLRRLAERFPDKFNRIKVIWSSPLIPSDPIVWRRDLPPAAKARVRDFLLGYARPAAGKSDAALAREREVMAQIKWSGFAPSDDGQLAPIRQLDLFRQRLRVEADPALSPEQRAAQLQELDSRLRLLDNP
jgi:phosphonate transport system substrate-binding protein